MSTTAWTVKLRALAATNILRALQPRSAPAERAAAARLAILTRWLAVMGAAVCVTSVVFAGAGASSEAAFGRGLLQLLVVGVPIAVGLYALRTPGNLGF